MKNNPELEVIELELESPRPSLCIIGAARHFEQKFTGEWWDRPVDVSVIPSWVLMLAGASDDVYTSTELFKSLIESVRSWKDASDTK